MSKLLKQTLWAPFVALMALTESQIFALTWRICVMGVILFGTKTEYPLWLQVMATIMGVALFANLPFAVRALVKNQYTSLPIWTKVTTDLSLLVLAPFVFYGFRNGHALTDWLIIIIGSVASISIMWDTYANLKFYFRVQREGEQAVARSLVQGVMDQHFEDDYEDIFMDLSHLSLNLREKSPWHWSFVDGPLHDEIIRARQMVKFGVI